MKTACCVSLCALLAVAGRAPAGELAEVERTTTARAGASAAAAERGTAEAGDTYPVARRRGAWVEVQFDGRRAWLRRDDVRLERAAVWRVEGEALAVRAGPGVHHPALGALPPGAWVAERAAEGEWREVSFRGRTGWVLAPAPVAGVAARDDALEEQAAAGRPLARRLAAAFSRMREAAARDGVELRLVRARPGHSGHRHGDALDIDVSARGVHAWLGAHAARFGFHRSVPGDRSRWELR